MIVSTADGFQGRSHRVSPGRQGGGVRGVMVHIETGSIEPEIFVAHYERLVGLAAALAGPSAAEDIATTVLLRCAGSRGWAQVENQTGYLTRSVVNEVRSQRRSTLRREAREMGFSQAPAAEDTYAVPEVVEALAKLPLQQRAVTFLTYWADLDPAAIADELEISEGSVRKHLARARKTLRRTLS